MGKNKLIMAQGRLWHTVPLSMVNNVNFHDAFVQTFSELRSAG